MLWLVASALILVWLIAVIFHKGGFIHILLLTAIAICVVQFLANRRALRG
jgi:hypothetical protein